MYSAPVKLLTSNAIFWLRLRLLCSSGSLSNGNGNENVKKAIGLDEQRQRREIRSRDVLWRTKTQDDNFFFLPENLGAAPKNSIQGKFNYIWDFTRLGIIARKFEKSEAFLMSDVFTALAVVVTKAPYVIQSTFSS